MTSIIINSQNIKYRDRSGKVFFTYQDIVSLPDWPDSPLLELINGELFVVPSPTISHQRISKQLYEAIGSYVKHNNLGEVFYAPIDVFFSEEDVTIPDLVFISRENSKIISEKKIEGSPELVIEILSSNKKRDLIEKKELYEKYQIIEYLVIDPIDKQLIAFHYNNSNSSFNEPIISQKSENYEFKVLGGLVLILDEIFKTNSK